MQKKINNRGTNTATRRVAFRADPRTPSAESSGDAGTNLGFRDDDNRPFHLRKLKDPLYGYVHLSELENRIIQHPLMLRLHHVRQNSTAFLTYPTAHGTRFAHSVGAMHLVGSIATRAFHAAEPAASDAVQDVIAQILKTVNINLDALSGRILEDPHETKLLNDDGLYSMYSLTPARTPSDLARLILFEGLRLACLVHDLGHPPFSHVAEHAFQKVVPAYKGHEEAGLELLDAIVTQLGDKCAPLGGPALAVAKALVRHVEPLAALSALVSGDVDADRLDYVRRDASTVNLSIAAYDSQRIVDSARLGVRNGKPLIYFTTDALSAVEAFFIARFQLYRWMIWHHNVIRMDLCLERALQLLSIVADDKLPDGARGIRSGLLAPIKSGLARDYVEFDDGTLITALRTLLHVLEAQPTLNEQCTDLAFYLRVFLLRKRRLLRPLWKQADEYREFATLAVVEKDKPVSAFNDQLRARLGNDPEQIIALEQHLTKALNRITRVSYLRFRPCPDEGFELFPEPSGKSLTVMALSPAVASLQIAWDEMPQLWIFVKCEETDDLLTAPLRKMCGNKMRDFLGRRP